MSARRLRIRLIIVYKTSCTWPIVDLTPNSHNTLWNTHFDSANPFSFFFFFFFCTPARTGPPRRCSHHGHRPPAGHHITGSVRRWPTQLSTTFNGYYSFLLPQVTHAAFNNCSTSTIASSQRSDNEGRRSVWKVFDVKTFTDWDLCAKHASRVYFTCFI